MQALEKGAYCLGKAPIEGYACCHVQIRVRLPDHAVACPGSPRSYLGLQGTRSFGPSGCGGRDRTCGVGFWLVLALSHDFGLALGPCEGLGYALVSFGRRFGA